MRFQLVANRPQLPSQPFFFLPARTKFCQPRLDRVFGLGQLFQLFMKFTAS